MTATIVGTEGDIVSRLRAVLPPAWFPVVADGADSTTPVLDGVLAGISTGWAYCVALLEFVRAQARISTATGSLLDLIATDFFGASIMRRPGETDAAFRARLCADLLVGRATRQAVLDTVQRVSGQTGTVFEPMRGADAGGYGVATVAARLGSTRLPFQYLVTASSRPVSCLRETAATYIDGAGVMRLARRRMPRPAFSGGTANGVVDEPRGFNLIKDSVGWSAFTAPSPAGAAQWTVQAADDAVWAGQTVLSVEVQTAGIVAGPATSVAFAGMAVTASIWLKIPATHTLVSCSLVVSDGSGDRVVGDADLGLAGSWQRILAFLAAGTVLGREVTLSLLGTSTGAMTAAILTQCWQLEPGSSATSYIPSQGQVGFRDADQLTAAAAGSAFAVDASGLHHALVRVIPAGSIAWTTITG